MLPSDSMTMLIFSYFDVHHRAVDFIKRLNSKGYDISRNQAMYKGLFEVYLKSQLMGYKIKNFIEEEIFMNEIAKKKQ